jgi:glutathione S-transferase
VTAPVLIVGSYVSPYVRKVLACLELKGLAYEIDPIVPFMGDDRFTALSPLRRIPVLVDDRVTLCDSTVICQYLEERYPQPSLLPADLVDRARARWLEEYADTRIAEVLIWRLFNQAVIRPSVWGESRDLAELERIRNEEIPPLLDHLEAELPAAGFLFGAAGIADLSIAVAFRNAAFARYQVDPNRWPRTAGFVDRVLVLPCLAKLQPFEAIMMRTPIAEHRAALHAAGAPIAATTYGSDTPRRGVMRDKG